MKKFIIRRFLQLIPVTILVSIFSFLIIYFAPGDPVNMYIQPEMTQVEIDQLRIQLGLDGSVFDQYIRWLTNILHGNLGNSLINHRPVSSLIMEKLPATIGLMGASFILSLLIAIPLGMISGIKKNRLLDNIISFLSYVGVSIPSFWFAFMLIILFSIKLSWLPSIGMRTLGVDSTLDLIKHMIMPTIVLSVSNTATFIRYMRSNTITQLEEEYVLTAMAKGVSKGKILFSHVLKNCLLPIITLAGMQIASLVVGSVIIESVFGWPGMGTLGMSAISSRDYPVIMGWTMLSSTILIIGNFIADILYGIIDPRIKQGVDEVNA